MSTGVITPYGDTHWNSAVCVEPIGTISRTRSTIPDIDFMLLSGAVKCIVKPSTTREQPLSSIAKY
jgi:hypothetical protein